MGKYKILVAGCGSIGISNTKKGEYYAKMDTEGF
jgi:hypothetical protein